VAGDIQRNILVAPLNWGLGHATRCIPVIRQLISRGFNPILASDGAALELLRKEFPQLISLQLPSYQIRYSNSAGGFRWQILKSLPSMLRAIREERNLVDRWISEYDLHGILSDNRPGAVSRKVPSVYMTHQVNVLSGATTWLTGKIHRNIIDKFDECWIPDFDGDIDLSGELGHPKKRPAKIRYIGPLSRFNRLESPKNYDLTILLSGPEPQRTLLENRLTDEIKDFDGKILIIRGKVGPKQTIITQKNVATYNFMTADQLQQVLPQGKIIICRSGYTTIMDLAKLGVKSFFIPTPGQYEQEYLAKKCKAEGWAPFTSQDDFKIGDLDQCELFSGIPPVQSDVDWDDLFKIYA